MPESPAVRTYTRAELDGMSADQLAANAEDITAAAREGRITDYQKQAQPGGTSA